MEGCSIPHHPSPAQPRKSKPAQTTSKPASQGAALGPLPAAGTGWPLFPYRRQETHLQWDRQNLETWPQDKSRQIWNLLIPRIPPSLGGRPEGGELNYMATYQPGSLPRLMQRQHEAPAVSLPCGGLGLGLQEQDWATAGYFVGHYS